MDNPALPNRVFYPLLATGILLNALGLLFPILEPDGALYATLAKTIAQSNDFINLRLDNIDWLDKPHFPFWMAALSMKIFGVNSLAYKLPALLFSLVSVWYTWQFARLWYAELVAQVAVLVLLTALHGVISNNDVRAEPYLTGQIIASAFHFSRIIKPSDKSLVISPFWGRGAFDLVLGAFWAGLALMTKGPFTLVPIGAGLVGHFLLTGNWRELLKPRWYVAIALTLLFSLPELYTLYIQFDAHPEKVVFGKTGVSGVQFFYWDSQFGRFFNTGPIKGSGDKFFFLHTLLWAFAPWSLLLYAGIGKAVWENWQNRRPATSHQPSATNHRIIPEYITLCGSLASVALFSLSAFQLPHYTNIIFPFFAIITAWFLVSLSEKAQRGWLVAQTVQVVLLAVLVGVLTVYFRPGNGTMEAWIWLWLWCGIVSLGLFSSNRWLGKNATLLNKLIVRTVGGAVLTLSFYNLFLYPNLLPYQAGGEAAYYLNAHPELTAGGQKAGMYRDFSHTFEFYLDQPYHYWRNPDTLRADATARPALVSGRRVSG
jgi:4-amino-4-deoxy-L-arabinose transferase-like glycosyltransferase